MIFVEGENSTEDDPCDPLTSIFEPDTESIDPITRILSGAAADEVADAVAGAADDSLVALSPLPDELQPRAASAVIPASAASEWKVFDRVRIAAPERRLG
ncbi:MAG: hypothetical protein KDB70_14180 [Mycobacterium sp.]|nr:hypothetical protein [Mycobacterium sp.]